MIAVGVMLLVWPAASLTIGAILIGAAVLVSGIVKLFEGFTASNLSGGMRAGYVAIGLLAVLAGCYLLLHHALSLFVVAFVAGVYFIAHGITEIGVGISGHVPARAARVVLGVFSIAAGIIMVVWPAISLVLLLTVVAAFLLFYGLMLCGLAYSLHKASKGEHAGAAGRAPSFMKKKKAGHKHSVADGLPVHRQVSTWWLRPATWSGEAAFAHSKGPLGDVTAAQACEPGRSPAAGSPRRACDKPSSDGS